MTPPPAGTWCIECMTQGHRCQAQMFGDDELPVCLPCANGDPCVVARVGAPKPRELFELEPGYEPAPVITRTPEELGIPRVVEPGAKPPPPEPRNPYSQSRVMDKPLRAHDYQQEGKEPPAMPHGIPLTEEQKQAIAAAGHSGLSASKIAREFGIGEETARRVCREAGVPPLPMGHPPGPRGPYKKRKDAEALVDQYCVPQSFTRVLDEATAAITAAEPDPTPQPEPAPDAIEVSLHFALTHKKADELWADFTLAEKATCIRRAIEDRWNGL